METNVEAKMIGAGRILAAAAVFAFLGASAAQAAKCPDSRIHLESRLNTRPADGRLYQLQRQAIRMRIDDVIRYLGGPANAYATAKATRADAVAKLEAGAGGAFRRYHLDTILRADALIEILECRGKPRV